MTKKWLIAGGAALAAVVPAIVRAPGPRLVSVAQLPKLDDAANYLSTAQLHTLDDAADYLSASDQDGWELVQAALDVVNARFTAHSCWHLWETSYLAFAHGRGFSDQYNLALARILAMLGFEVVVVHSARVRIENQSRPWWLMSHTWLKVRYDGCEREVSAGRLGRVGQLSFTPVSEPREVHPWTLINIRLAMTPLVVAQLWKSWVTKRPVPSWIYRELNETT